MTTNSSTNEAKTAKRPKAFVSYSHADSAMIERLQIHLKPIIKKYDFQVWDDTKLRAGERWKKQIDYNLSTADVIVVFLSADFLASEFVMDYEYPKALSLANQRGAKIVVIMVSPCLYEEFEIAEFHFLNDPKSTLQDLQADDTAAEHERVFVKCAKVIRDYLREAEKEHKAD